MGKHNTVRRNVPLIGSGQMMKPLNNPSSARFAEALVGCCLLVLVGVVFLQAVGYEFVNFDDGVYVYENPYVANGLTARGAVWAFGFHEANWHPLTWLSLMADANLAAAAEAAGLDFGPAGVYHLTNVVLHAANAILLFILLRTVTGSLWRSFFVASLFAVHPLHVESVAWVTERKDVLSTFFWFVAMLAYARWASAATRACWRGVVLAFALGLMAKPMLVTLPIVLLLMDFWPLGRLGRPQGYPAWSEVLRLMKEKAVLFALAGCSCVLTFWAQRAGGAVMKMEWFPFLPRFLNALVSYGAYIRGAIWPAELAVFYPMKAISARSLVVAVAVLVAASVFAVRAAKSERTRWFTLGWFWYVVTLVPVIGLVQVGMQAMADRYTYVPLVGIFIMAAWGIPAIAERVIKQRAARTAVLLVLGAAAVLALAAQAHRQVGYWRSSTALFERALSVTGDNYFAEANYAAALEAEGRLDEALEHYRKAARIRPGDYEAPLGIGTVLTRQFKYAEAEEYLRKAVSLAPADAKARNNLGGLLLAQGRVAEAIEQFEEALRINPDYAGARRNLDLARSMSE